MVIVRSGIGKVNAGICTQILADVFQVDAVINTGIAGSLDARIDIGDIVISTDTVQHDMDATGFGYDPGVIPRMETSFFKADNRLVEAAEAGMQGSCAGCKCLYGTDRERRPVRVRRETKNRISSRFDGLCTEMEGAAIAQAAC